MTGGYPEFVRAVVTEADRQAAAQLGQRVNKGVALAQVLADRKGLEYKPASVRAWMRGDAMPPADVFLAVAGSVGISLDERLGTSPQAEELTRQVAALTSDVDGLRREAAASGELLARVIGVLDRAGLWDGRSAERGQARGAVGS